VWFSTIALEISNPILGVYDIVISAYIPSFLYSDYYVIYLKFNSNTNAVTIQQAIAKITSGISGISCRHLKLTRNGKYLLLVNSYLKIWSVY
jgi:hypothetical protein